MFSDQELVVVSTIFHVLRPNEIVRFLHKNSHLLPYIIKKSAIILKFFGLLHQKQSAIHIIKNQCAMSVTVFIFIECDVRSDFLIPSLSRRKYNNIPLRRSEDGTMFSACFIIFDQG